MAYTVYCAMDGCNTLAITHNPEAAGSSPVPATMFNRWFRKKSAVFLYFFEHLENIRVGNPENGKSYGKAVVSKKCTTWRCFFWYLKSKFWVYFEQQAKGECISTYITFDFNSSSEVTSKTRLSSMRRLLWTLCRHGEAASLSVGMMPVMATAMKKDQRL